MSEFVGEVESDLEEFDDQLCEEVKVSADLSRWDPSVSSTPTSQRRARAAGQYITVCFNRPGGG